MNVPSLCQRPYIESIARRFGFDELKPMSNPMEPSTKLHSGQSPSTGAEYAAMRHVPYREAVGSLMYASLATHPDISYAVTTVSRFSNNPGMPHWEAVRRIYRYLLGMKDLRLTYGGAPSALVGYADADGSMAEDRKAISGYAFLIDGGIVSWSSKKQEIISLSTMESEYVAATHAAKELYGCGRSSESCFRHSTNPPHCSLIISQLWRSQRTISTTHIPSISTSISISYAGSWKTERSASSIALLLTWSPIP